MRRSHALLVMPALGALATAVLSCGSSQAPAGTCGYAAPAQAGACGSFDVVAALSDYSSSEVGGCAADGGTRFAAGIDLGADPAMSVSRGRAFFLARDVGTIFEVDPHCGKPLAKLSANDPGHSGTTDPQDLAVAPDGSLWVTRYYVPSILHVGGSACGKVDLSSFDPDGNPQASAIRIVDGIGSPPASKAFVALQRLDDNHMLHTDPNKPSLMLRIDVASGKVEAEVILQGKNPFQVSDVIDGALYLAEPGNFDAVDEPAAGIERFDVATSTSALLVRESALGGSAAEVAVHGACGVAIVADASSANLTSLVAFDVTRGAVLASAANPILPTSAGYFLQALAWVGDNVLLVGDGDPKAPRAAVVHVLDRSPGTCTFTERTRISVPLKPVALRAP